jgi:MFS family permease
MTSASPGGGAGPRATPSGIETVEELVRSKLSEALGGRRGIVESAVPTVLFTIMFVSTRELRLSLIVAIAATVLLLLIRLLQRSTVQFVLNALIGIGIAALFASRSGEARDVFLPGILYNGAYAAVFIFTILIGWPLVGFMIGSITGDPTGWHDDRNIVKLCSQLTWLFAAPCVLRVLVQYPLYLDGNIALLGTAKVVLGWPLQLASFAAMAWLLSRNRTPIEPGEEPS